MATPQGYSRTQIALHWVVAVLIAGQFIFHEAMSDAWDIIEDGGAISFDPLVSLHVFGGIAVLAFALWRLVLRQARGVPPPPATAPPLSRLAAHAGHIALYALMILMPVSGVVAWFGGVEAAAEAHEAMKPALIVLVLVHVGASLWHQFWLKDGLLLRMKKAQD